MIELPDNIPDSSELSLINDQISRQEVADLCPRLAGFLKL